MALKSVIFILKKFSIMYYAELYRPNGAWKIFERLLDEAETGLSRPDKQWFIIIIIIVKVDL